MKSLSVTPLMRHGDEEHPSVGKVGCENIEYDEEHRAGGALYCLCRETEQPQRDLLAITMSTVGVIGLCGFLTLCFGMLLGSTWSV
jgi:hypothetical protein